MRTNKTGGFTLIELLIVIAIIGILAAVLIPNLLNARARAFDTGAQTCARSVSTALEVNATNHPFEYDTEIPTRAAVGATCDGVDVDITAAATTYTIEAKHQDGRTTYTISNGTGVTTVAGNPAVTNNLN